MQDETIWVAYQVRSSNRRKGSVDAEVEANGWDNGRSIPKQTKVPVVYIADLLAERLALTR